MSIVDEMKRFLTEGNERYHDWMSAIVQKLDTVGNATEKFNTIQNSLKELNASEWQRNRLQTRFFETGKKKYL